MLTQSMRSTTRVALVQNQAGPEFEANLARLDALLDEAAAGGAELAALPEYATCLAMRDGKLAVGAEPFEDHRALHWARDRARRQDLWLLLGSIGVAEGDGKIKNRCCLIDRGGELVAAYDKIHLFDVDLASGESYRESDVVAPGRAAVVADTPLGRTGLSICYDLRFPQLYRSLAQAGARVLTVPAAFTATTGRAHWTALLRARAIENSAFVIAPGQCGAAPDGSLKRYGHSAVVAPWGEILVEGGDDEGVFFADIALKRADEARRMIPALRHDRPYAPPSPI